MHILTSIRLVEPHPHFLLDVLAVRGVRIFVNGIVSGEGTKLFGHGGNGCVHIRIGNNFSGHFRKSIRRTATHLSELYRERKISKLTALPPVGQEIYFERRLIIYVIGIL